MENEESGVNQNELSKVQSDNSSNELNSAAQLIDPSDIKKEIQIKEEPDPIEDVELVIVRRNQNHEAQKDSVVCSMEASRNVSTNNIDAEINATGIEENNPSSLQQDGENGNEIVGPESTSKRYKCTQCQYSTQLKGNLNQHMLKHTGEKPFGCEYCAKRFKSNQSLRAHMKVHVEEFLFHCSVCLEGFDEKDKKMEHENNCKIKRYECHVCKKSFGSIKNNLELHIRVHSGNKPFECTECNKQFTLKHHMTRHKKIHGGPRSFRCSNGRIGFSKEDERNLHEEICERCTFECHICGKFIGIDKGNLTKHMRTHNGIKPFKCQQCLKCFTQKRNLNRHQILHTKKLPFKCSICRYGFSDLIQRNSHQKNCRQLGYECHLCGKYFGDLKTNLKIHLRTHSGEKPFICELCHVRFTNKSNLNSHLKHIHNKKIMNNSIDSNNKSIGYYIHFANMNKNIPKK